MYYRQSRLQYIFLTMDCLRIPTLNLHKHRKPQREKQYQRIETDSVNLLVRSKSKEVLQDIKLEMYLKNYNKNLNYLVSPSKYKDKAKDYLANMKSTQQLYLLRMKFPQSRLKCPHCYYITKNQAKKCQCEMQTERKAHQRQGWRSKYCKFLQNDKYDVWKRQKSVQKRQTNIKKHIKIIEQQSTQKNHYSVQNSEESFHYTERSSIQSRGRKIIEQNNNKIIREQTQLLKKKRFQENNQAFLQSLKGKQNQLQNYRLNLNDESTLNIDFSDIMLAKREYIDKSKQILHKLDEIISNSQRQK